MSNEPIDMSKITFQYGGFLIILGVLCYIISDSEKKETALIPAIFGMIFLVGNYIAENEKWKMHVMHVLVLLALVGVISGLVDQDGMTGLLAIITGGDAGLANMEKAAMSIASAVYMYFCIQSFKQARLASKED